MLKKTSLLILILSFLSFVFYLSLARSAKESTPKGEGVCLECHETIKSLKVGTKHASLSCERCHSKLAEHLKDPLNLPETNLELSLCGRCHPFQYETFVSVNLKSRAKVEKATTTSRSPTFDLLMMPHGFTREHDEPRSHIFMLTDHLLVDRAYGGIYQLKSWKEITKPGKVWDLLVDTGKELPQTAKAGNTVCLTCKTTDTILKWPYMGDPHPATDLKRGGNPAAIYMVKKYLKNPMGCIHCHDPHGAKPRVVRDALIEAVVSRKEGTYPYNKEKSKKVTMTKIEFERDGKPFRAIGILNKPDSNVLCAQCHVEYNCNQGFDPKTGVFIGMDDRRTNYFPWVNVFGIQRRYAELGFKDFYHATTGAPLTKLQHPETETFWGSKHERGGVECKDCHMPKVKDKKGKLATYHGQRSARYMLKDTCGRCHAYWSQEEAEYQVDAIQNYVRGKMRKAEFWLGRLIETYTRARDMGVRDDILREVWPLHDKAHILWEWWTAENSDGFHNPEQARESLAQSINTSQEAIRILERAIEEKRR
ncbi:MAG: ammonia-forming cytochrome c nitrite reductase subunit c552 [Thermodesulfobacteriota bacterium]